MTPPPPPPSPPSPPPPLEADWCFTRDLQAPLWTDHGWCARAAWAGEAALGDGVVIVEGFPDSAGVLETAYTDLRKFFDAGGVGCDGGYRIETRRDAGVSLNAHWIEVGGNACLVAASDAEGIRRGIFHLQRLMLDAGGTFLPIGKQERQPVIKTRISRCFFGPIKRPPRNRDELTDDGDYYPAEYLNRLAHDGVNALWLSVAFRDLCRSRFFPSFGSDADRRLEKLRRTVDRCARYGIRIYAFAIEPLAFGNGEHQLPLAEAARHPEMVGHKGNGNHYFCPSSRETLAYLEEATHTLFSEALGLGGLINITFGERPTHCFCASETLFSNNCPRCSGKRPPEVIAAMLDAMAKGMHSGNPEAELIAWFYTPQLRETPDCRTDATKAMLRGIAAEIPPHVTLQLNFESTGTETQLGKPRPVLDYTLAHVGPSDLFESCAAAAKAHGAGVSAKLQVGCSHEMATVPFVPVPGNIYRKYRKMRELGVTGAMQCWYFGNYPSVMTRAAGRCSDAPLPQDENVFLLELARGDWGEDAAVVVEAWKQFRDAYEQFPANLLFTHYSPAHDCVTWPLYLKPVDMSIAPSWKFGFPEISGDRIGECFGYGHTIEEILILMERVADGWETGWEMLHGIAGRYSRNRERRLDLGVAEALAIQFRSAWRVIRFYHLREELPWLDDAGPRLEVLADMKALVADEITGGRRLARLAAADTRLGFHSEAEGHKYFPAKLEWRARRLEVLLEEEFPEVEAAAAWDILFAGFAGRRPAGVVHTCPVVEHTPVDKLPWDCAEAVRVGDDAPGFVWQALGDGENLYLRAVCPDVPDVTPSGDSGTSFFDRERMVFTIEPRRLWPNQRFHVDALGGRFQDEKGIATDPRWSVVSKRGGDGWETVLTIPWVCLRDPWPAGRPLRINVERFLADGRSVAWIPRNPLPSRLHFGTDNPKDAGWLVFEKHGSIR